MEREGAGRGGPPWVVAVVVGAPTSSQSECTRCRCVVFLQRDRNAALNDEFKPELTGLNIIVTCILFYSIYFFYFTKKCLLRVNLVFCFRLCSSGLYYVYFLYALSKATLIIIVSSIVSFSSTNCTTVLVRILTKTRE